MKSEADKWPVARALTFILEAYSPIFPLIAEMTGKNEYNNVFLEKDAWNY